MPSHEAPGPPRIGITAYGMEASDLLALAVAAEGAGFSSLWIGEHIVLPVGYASEHPSTSQPGQQRHHTGPIVDPDTPLTESLVALGAIAAATTRLEVGTAIYLLALRHPLLVARGVAAVQDLAGGRFLLGVGTGWLSEEFEALSIDFATRVSRFDEAATVLKAALAGGPFEHHGRHFDTGGVVQLTRDPVPVPLVYGGNTERALWRAATGADGWFASGTPSFDEAIRLRDRLLRIRAGEGRTTPFRCFMRVSGSDPSHLARYVEAGFEDILVWADQVWRPDASPVDRRAGLERAAAAFGLRPTA
jgi:probable F420-dependent oxidoreductase